MGITRQQAKLLDAAEIIRLAPGDSEAAFMARQLVQATLPHKNPGDIPAWSRTNGNLTLTIRPGWNDKTKAVIGYPYGTLPRLLLFWMTTEALRTKSRRLELGNNLSSFMRQLGLNRNNGGTGAKRSDARRLQDQMQRLFQANISFTQTQEKGSKKGTSWLNMPIAPKGMMWWDEKAAEQGALWNSWIQLGEDFFAAITATPVPVDMRALKALKNSALALDLYSWATYTAFQTQQSGQSRSVSWELLHEQFGAEYNEIRNFQTKAWAAFRKIQAVYPELGIERERGGVRVLPCNPAVTVKASHPPVDKAVG